MSYTFVSFNVPGAVRTEGLGIDENGRIVGLYVDANNVTHGFVDRGGVFTTIDDSLGVSTVAAGINDPGRIAGYYIDKNGLAHGFFDNNGSFTTINDPSASGGTFAQGLNEPDRIVGYYVDASGLNHGFLDNGGVFSTVDDPLGTKGTFAQGINNPGDVVGYYKDSAGTAHGFLDHKGSFTTVDDPLGTKGTFALGINEPGQIIGYYLDANGLQHGFLLSGGSYTTIDDPLGIGGTVATGIADNGQIVGYYFDANGVQHGFRAETLQPANGNPDFDNGWNITGTGQTTGDGLSDLVWQNQNSHLVEIQFLNGSTTLGGGTISNSAFDANWQAVAVGDFNGDGMADIAYRRISDGLTELQFLNGTTVIGGGLISNNSFGKDWNVVGAADFNGDGYSDLVWQHNADNLVEIQFLSGTSSIGGGLISNNPFGPGWNVVGTGDFNGDGKTDLLWQHQGDGLVEVQFLDGTTAIGGGAISNNSFGAGWNVVGTGDFNGDGKTDLVWEHQGDHLVEVQFLNGTTAIGGGAVAGSPFGSDWRVAGTGDFNGDGKTDLVYRRVNNGLKEVQFLNGITPIGGGAVSFDSITHASSAMMPATDIFSHS
jgi:hypothetical protein